MRQASGWSASRRRYSFSTFALLAYPHLFGTMSPSPPSRLPITRRGPRLYSDAITREDAHLITQAVEYAETIGKPLNTTFTIRFPGSRPFDPERKGKGVRAGPDNTRACRNCVVRVITDVSSEFGIVPTYLFVFENHPKGGRGLHLHGCLHVPHHCRRRFLNCWKQKLERTLDVQVNPNSDQRPVHFEQTARDYETALGWMRYFLKGWETPQGRIYGRRLTVSHSIGPTARKLAGFPEATSAENRDEAVSQLSQRYRARRLEGHRTVVGAALRRRSGVRERSEARSARPRSPARHSWGKLRARLSIRQKRASSIPDGIPQSGFCTGAAQ